MAGYIGKVQIGNDSSNLISLGDTLYGTCSTPAATATKVVVLADFDRVIDGVQIRVKFENGNSADTSVTLQVGSTSSYLVEGDCICATNEVISFTWEQGSDTSHWRVTGGGISQGIKEYVGGIAANLLGTADAMVFRGTIGTTGNITTLPASGYQAGWTYKVITAGQYGGKNCEVGDLIIAIADAGANQAAVNPDHWTVAQGNLDGAVTGPAETVGDTHVAIFDGTTGTSIKDSGFTIGKSVPADAKFTDNNTTYTLNTTSINAYTANTTMSDQDNEGTILVTVDRGILKLARGIKFTTTTTTVGTSLSED